MRVLIILFVTVFFSCKSSETATQTEAGSKSQSIAFSELNSGTNGGFNEKVNQVITDQNTYNEVWAAAFSKFANPQKPNRIDFEKNMVLLVAMGERTSGGYTIKIKSIDDIGENIKVTIKEEKPGTSCMTTSVMTYPYQIVELPKQTKKIMFDTVEKVVECSKDF